MTNLEVHHQQFRSHSGGDSEFNLNYSLPRLSFSNPLLAKLASVNDASLWLSPGAEVLLYDDNLVSFGRRGTMLSVRS